MFKCKLWSSAVGGEKAEAKELKNKKKVKREREKIKVPIGSSKV